jgi:aryl-alcohol dehydrogenase-like predicted oxidoreductase
MPPYRLVWSRKLSIGERSALLPHPQTLAQMALAWGLRHPVVTSALIGASRVDQIDDAVAALRNLAFLQKELATMETILGR